MTRTTPRRFTILHRSHRGLTDAATFISPLSSTLVVRLPECTDSPTGTLLAVLARLPLLSQLGHDARSSRVAPGQFDGDSIPWQQPHHARPHCRTHMGDYGSSIAECYAIERARQRFKNPTLQS